MSLPKYYDAADVAAALKVSERTARRYMRTMLRIDGGEGRRLLRVSEAALQRWLNNLEADPCRASEDSGNVDIGVAAIGTAGIRSRVSKPQPDAPTLAPRSSGSSAKSEMPRVRPITPRPRRPRSD